MKEADNNLDAIALVQACRALREHDDSLALRLWLRWPRFRLDVYAIAIILAKVVADNTEGEDLESLAVGLSYLEAEMAAESPADESDGSNDLP